MKYDGTIKEAWVVSPDQEGKVELPFDKEGEQTIVRIPNLLVYKIVVLEK
jgi:hypothetical protein